MGGLDCCHLHFVCGVAVVRCGREAVLRWDAVVYKHVSSITIVWVRAIYDVLVHLRGVEWRLVLL